MKQLACEMCGGADLVKKDGVFICQNCGTKYSVEEARKMMIEGIVDVKVNKTNELSGYLEAARRAKKTQNFEDMERFYTLAKEIDPSDWESIFYSVYAKAACCKVIKIGYYAELIKNTLLSIVDVFIEGEFDDKSEKAGQLILDIIAIYKMLYSASLENLKQFFSQKELRDSHANVVDDCIFGFGNTMDALKVICTESGVLNVDNERLIVIGYDTLQKMIVQKYDIYYASYPYDIGDVRSVYNDMIEGIEYRIKLLGYGKEHIKPELKKPMEPIQSNSKQVSGGCYIATAVYGSYDCPEVWTLRRYRDYALAETWYGRTFIHIYYIISPTLVKWFGNTKWFKRMWRRKLDNMVKKLQDNGYESTPYQDKML